MIKDLKAREGEVDIVVEITEISPIREFEKFGKAGRVANATAKDDTGEIKLTLWNDDIDKVKVGDKVHIVNGYVGEWQGEKQLSTGKFGKLEIVEQ
ncbi:DNA-binding protein [Candidatus Woesearchaeota archaeon]|jgi:replication factor A1|nr:DNA-binding protein [Candidatus Woesearchaeota archaeon]|tara:strand:- start:1668 stop:1955 length:288 start_codon:yes stop_codon:yes gene_type:complete